MRVSQCMIVKNEESNIERALSWAKGIVWEQIVVDTGSTDQTAEIAESMGAKVYHLEWADDFAVAKNFAISKAKGDWIAFLDADESFAAEDAAALAAFLEKIQDSDMEAVATAWMNLNEKGEIGNIATQIRIFRNRPDLRYKRRIHEQLLADEGRRKLRVADATGALTIIHTGYCGGARARKRTDNRNLRLIRKELEENPGSHEMLGYLGDEYNAMDCFEEAVRCYQEAIEAMPAVLDERDLRSSATFSYLLQLLSRGKAPDKEIVKIYQKAVSLLPGEADFDYFVGRNFAMKGQYDTAIQYLGLALGKLEKFGTNNRSMMLQANLQDAYEVLAICFFNQGNLQKAMEYSIAVLRYSLHSMTALVILVKCFMGSAEIPRTPEDQAADFLLRLYDRQSLKDRTILLAAARENGWQTLEKELERLFTDAETEK